MTLQKPAFKQNDTVWLCLTTLRHRRFVEDAVHVIGLPPGAHIRLRYHQPYVNDDLWVRVTEQVFPKKTQVLVALAGTDAIGANQVTPLRLGRLVSARCEGSVLVLDVALDEFLNEVLPIGTFWKELQRNATGLPTCFGASAPSEGTYLQQLSAAPQTLTAGLSIKAWEIAAQGFFRMDDLAASEKGHRCTSFLYYLNGFPSRVLQTLEGGGALILEAGSAVALEVHTTTRRGQRIIMNALGEVRMELSHPSAQFTSSRRVRVDSLRDVKSVGLATTALFRRTYGHLSVRMISFRYGLDNGPGVEDPAAGALQSANGREEVVVARYDFPLRVGRWRPWVASGMVALAAAIAVYDAPESETFEWVILLLPACAFVLAFSGLVLGLRREGGA